MKPARFEIWIGVVFCTALCYVVSTSSESDNAEHLKQIASLLRVVHARSLEQKAHMQRLETLMKELLTSGKAESAVRQAMSNVKINTESMLSKIVNVESILFTLTPQEQKLPFSGYATATDFQETHQRLMDMQATLNIMSRSLQSLQFPGNSDGSLTSSLSAMKIAMLDSITALEKELELNIGNLATTQQVILKNLHSLLSANNERVVLHQIQEALDANFNRHMSNIEQNVLKKIQNLEAKLPSVCTSRDYYPQTVSNPQSQLEFTASHGVLSNRRYNPSGIDIISPPVPSQNVEVGRRLKASLVNDRSYLDHKPAHCADIHRLGFRKTGIYEGYVDRHSHAIPLYCDMETAGGGWTVVLRRDNTYYPQISFDRVWSAYKNGFGDLNGEFWLGNRYLHSLTSAKRTVIRFDIVNHLGHRSFAEYESFLIHNEHRKYLLNIGKFIDGTATDEFSSHNGSYFSTPEEDNDRHPGRNCAETFYGGWWFDNCFRVYLTGHHVFPLNEKAIQGIYWGFRFPGNVRLKAAEMKVRPADFK